MILESIKEALNVHFGGMADDDLKKALSQHYEEVAKGVLAEKAQEAGISQLESTIGILESLPKRWEQIRADFETLQTQKGKVAQHLAALCGPEEGRTGDQEALVQEMRSWGASRTDSPEKIATKYIDACSETNAERSFGWMMSGGTVEKNLEDIISNQNDFVQKIENGQLKEIFSQYIDTSGWQWKTQSYRTDLTDPEWVEKILAEQTRFYQEFEALLTTPSEVLQKIPHGVASHLGETILPKSLQELGIERGKEHLSFDGVSCVALRDTSLPKVKENIQKTRTELEAQVSKWKEEIGDKIEVDWADQELHFLVKSQGGHRKIDELHTLVRRQNRAEELSPGLEEVARELEDKMEERVTYAPGQWGPTIRFDSASDEDFNTLTKELDSRKRELEEKERDLQGADAAFQNANMLTRKAAQTKASDAKRARDQAKEQHAESEQKLETKNGIDQKLTALRHWLDAAVKEEYHKGINLKISRGSSSLREFIELLRKQLKETPLTPKQSQTYEQHQALLSRQEKTRNTYQTKWSKRL